MFLFENHNGHPIPRLHDKRKSTPAGHVDILAASEVFRMSVEELKGIYFSFFDGLIGKTSGCRARRVGLGKITDAQALDLLWKYRFPQLEEHEFRFVLEDVDRRGLSIWSQHVWVEKKHRRGQKPEILIMTTIGGLRAMATRTGQYAGRDRTEFEYGETGIPINAVVTVYRRVKGARERFVGEAAWEEFDQAQSEFWQRKPKTMLAKVAEAAALRAAFPEVLSGLYERSEIAPDRPPTPGDELVEEVTRARAPGDEQTTTRMQLETAMFEMGITSPERRREVLEQFRRKHEKLSRVDEYAFNRLVLVTLKKSPEVYGAA